MFISTGMKNATKRIFFLSSNVVKLRNFIISLHEKNSYNLLHVILTTTRMNNTFKCIF